MLAHLLSFWVNVVFLLAVSKLNVDRYLHHNKNLTVSNDSFRKTKKRAYADWRVSVKTLLESQHQ